MIYSSFPAIDVEQIPTASAEATLVESESVICLSAVHISEPLAKPVVQLTQKAKKARKRRGTFENEVVAVITENTPVALVKEILCGQERKP